MDEMFMNCSSLETMPKITKWKISKFSARNIFDGCDKKLKVPSKYKKEDCLIY